MAEATADASPPSERGPRIALAMITRNSAEVIDRCLDSVASHVDEIVVYDTGSTDDTVERLESRNAAVGPPVTVRRGEWRDDFAWARERSFELVSPGMEWVLWLDDDDVLAGAEQLRPLVASAEPSHDGLAVLYEYTHDEQRNVVMQLWRERVVRRDGTLRWDGVVHEALRRADGLPARLRRVPPDRMRVVHQRPPARSSSDRNLTLLQAELERAERRGVPVDNHTLVYLAAEHMARDEYDAAKPYLEEYLARPATWPDERAQMHHRLARCMLRSGDAETALAVELASLAERDDWGETAAGLTEAYAALDSWVEVERWATQTLKLGPPQTELPVNPAEFTFLPLIHLAESCFRQGRTDEGQKWLVRAWAARGSAA